MSVRGLYEERISQTGFPERPDNKRVASSPAGNGQRDSTLRDLMPVISTPLLLLMTVVGNSQPKYVVKDASD